jgi:hypothetical protein
MANRHPWLQTAHPSLRIAGFSSSRCQSTGVGPAGSGKPLGTSARMTRDLAGRRLTPPTHTHNALPGTSRPAHWLRVRVPHALCCDRDHRDSDCRGARTPRTHTRAPSPPLLVSVTVSANGSWPGELLIGETRLFQSGTVRRGPADRVTSRSGPARFRPTRSRSILGNRCRLAAVTGAALPPGRRGPSDLSGPCLRPAASGGVFLLHASLSCRSSCGWHILGCR